MFLWYSISILRAWLILALLAAGVSQPVVQANRCPHEHQECREYRSARFALVASIYPLFPITQHSQTKERGHEERSKNLYQYLRQVVGWFWPPIWSNWALVIVAIGGICVALGTLEKIRVQADIMQRQSVEMKLQREVMARQTTEMAKAADAARDGVEIIINKERARIRIDPEPLNLFAAKFDESGYLMDVSQVAYRVICAGFTNAIVGEHFHLAVVTESEDRPDFMGYRHSNDMPLPAEIAPNQELRNSAFILPSVTLDAAEIADILGQKKFIHFYVLIRYKDVFNRVRDTAWWYRWSSPQGLFGFPSESAWGGGVAESVLPPFRPLRAETEEPRLGVKLAT